MFASSWPASIRAFVNLRERFEPGFNSFRRRPSASKSRKSIRKRYWLNLELLEDRFAPTYGVLSLGAPVGTVAPGHTIIVPVNFTDTDASGNSLNSSAALKDTEVVISYDATQVKIATGVFSGSYATSDGSVSLGKITSEPGTNSQDGYPWAFTNSFLDNFDNTPTGSNPGVLVVEAARLGTYGLPGGTNDFGAGSVFLIAFQVQPGAAVGNNTIINLRLNVTGTNFSSGSTSALSTDPTSGTNSPYSLIPAPSNTAGDFLDAKAPIGSTPSGFPIPSSTADTTTTVTGPTTGSAACMVATIFTATVTGTANSPLPSGPMDGTVTFYDGGTSLGVGTITDDGLGDDVGTATFAASTLSAGPHVISAVYNGDGSNYLSNELGGYWVSKSLRTRRRHSWSRLYHRPRRLLARP